MLSILGPVAFAFSVWDGFQSTLGQWFTRYISVYLWLPVSDLFSTLLAKLQVLMLQNDIQELQNNPDYSIDNSNSVYIIFMLIGIIGYFTVPTVAGWIVQAGGAGNFQPQPEPYRHENRQLCGRSGRCRIGKYRRTVERQISLPEYLFIHSNQSFEKWNSSL